MKHSKGKAEQQPSVLGLLCSLDPVQTVLGTCSQQPLSSHTQTPPEGHVLSDAHEIHPGSATCLCLAKEQVHIFTCAFKALVLLSLTHRTALQVCYAELHIPSPPHCSHTLHIYSCNFPTCPPREVSTLRPDSHVFFISVHPSHLLNFKHSVALPTDKNSCTFRSPLSSPASSIFAGDNKNLTGSSAQAKPHLSQCA